MFKLKVQHTRILPLKNRQNFIIKQQKAQKILNLFMKRKIARKCDSFDFIRISPKRDSTHNNNINSISLREPSQNGSPTLHHLNIYKGNNNKDKHYLQLPKIHAMNPIKLKKIQKQRQKQRQKQKQRQSQGQYYVLQNRLLLLGYQYRKQHELNINSSSHSTSNKSSLNTDCVHQDNNINASINKQKQKQKERRKKISLVNKQNYVSKKIFWIQILSNFGIAEIVLERKKLLVYVQQGNNSRMVKEMLRKRGQIDFVKEKKDANFVWTSFCDYQISKLSSKFTEEKVMVKVYNSQIQLLNDEQQYKMLLKTQQYSPTLYTPQLKSSASTISKQNQQTGTINISNSQSSLSHSYNQYFQSSAICHHTTIPLNFQSQSYQQTNLCPSPYMQPPSSSISNSSQLPSNSPSYSPISNNLYVNKQKQRLIFQQFHYHNHLTNHYQITDKKFLFSNLSKYCKTNKINVFELVPLTFQIRSDKYQLSQEVNNQKYWFIKPGEDTNRGNGISIAQSIDKVKEQINKLLKIGKTVILQQYIDPLLYRNRKFDIRCYTLILTYRGQLHAYWYKQGYIRTCSKQFNYDITDLYAHLTNDAVQKTSPQYSKYQQSNKLSFSTLESYLKSKQISFQQIIKSMKQLVFHSIKSVQNKLKNTRQQFNFQIFGYDFLIDKKGKVWLIEINTNPCLEFTGSLTARVIGHMIDNSFKIAVDPIINTQNGYISWKQQHNKIIQDNKFEQII